MANPDRGTVPVELRDARDGLPCQLQRLERHHDFSARGCNYSISSELECPGGTSDGTVNGATDGDTRFVYSRLVKPR